MSKYLSLTKVLLSGFSFFDAKSEKKNAGLKNIAIILLLVVSLLPTAGLIYYVTNKFYYTFSLLNQEGIIIAVGLLISSMMVFIFGIFLIPAVFYFSKDVESLLPLPLKPETILSAKFTNVLLYEYVTNCVVLAPIMISFIVNKKFDIITIIFSLICFFTIPIVPLIYSSLISMVIMRFAPLVKSRDAFNLISGIVAIVVALSMSGLGRKVVELSEEDIIDLILEGNNSLYNLINTIFPTIEFGMKAISERSIIHLLVYLIITVLAYVIFIVIAKLIYFKGVIGIGESTKSKKSLDIQKTVGTSRKQSILITYILKEWKLIFRTPVYFMNCILMMIIMPLLFIFPSLMGTNNMNYNEILKLVDLTNPRIITLIIIGSIALGMVYGTLNSITSTCISREGQNYYFMKYIPVSYKTQVNAKVLSGIILSSIGCLFIIIPIIYVIKLNLIYLPIMWILAIIGTVFTSYIGIIIDLFRPVLVWDNEQKAVKQNLNAIIGMLLGVAFAGVLVFVGMMLFTGVITNIEPYILTVIIIVICLMLDVAIYLLTHKLATGFINKL